MNTRNLVFSLVGACVLLIGLAAWAGPAPETTAGAPESRAYLHSMNLPSSGIAIEGYCPVAYFAADKAIKGKPEYAADYDGVTYHFVSADAKRMFVASPEKYVPAFGGWCAFGMSIGDKFPVDPYAFKIVDGRLMLFLRNPGIDARALWNKSDQSKSLEKAAAHWKKVSK